MALKDVALHLGVSWNTVKEIQRRHLETRYAKPKLKGVRRIAIDEISVGQWHRYVTVVLDLDRGAVVFVGEGKGADALDPFWQRLPATRVKIDAVATDMSAAYTLAVRENLPGATHVFDRFHVVKLFNEQLSQLRRELYHEATKLERPVLKGTRWLLLKNPDNLDESRNEHERLKEALKLNASLAAAYYLKEDLRQFWEQPTRVSADCFLDRWCARAEATGTRRMQETGEDHAGPPPGPSGLVHPSDLDRTTRRNEHEDPSPSATILRLQRPCILPAQDLRPTRI